MNRIPEIGFRVPASGKVASFEIVDLEELTEKRQLPLDHDPFTYHKLNFYAVLMLTAGRAEHRVDFQSCRLVPGDTLIILRGQVHAFDPAGKYRGWLLLFTDEYLMQYFSQSILDKLVPLFDSFAGLKKFHLPEESSAIVKRLQREIAGTLNNILAEVCASLIAIFLLKLGAQQAPHHSTLGDENQQTFHAFRKLIEKNHRHTRDAKQYAKELLVSYKHLNAVCKSCTAMTAKRLIDDFVILEAKRYLIATKLSIKEVSYQLGFDEPTNFQKFFKRHTAFTAGEFRQKKC